MAVEQTASTSETCPSCGTVIDTTEAEPLARVACPNCGEKVRVQRSFNNFELVETLGIGGMGTVYKARDTLLDRFVALKLLRKDLGDEIDYAKRLQQEARVAASVNHPNVIQVYSSGRDHDQFYLVMELVDHGSLDDLIEQKQSLPEELVLETGIQVAKGLRAAYAKGLIHRDVKPANILFADEHTAKIGDFGLAGMAAESGETKGEIWGTPYYVAPERLYHQPEDFRSDMYSLGATLFHAIAGRAPIEGDTNSATALRDLKLKPLNLKTIAPRVSEETARVFSRMIAPEPDKRYASYDECVAALEHAYTKLTGKELARTERRSKLPWIIGAVVLAAALVVVATWAYRIRQRSTVEAAKAERMVALAPLEGRLADARHELQQVHYNKAKETFARIADDARGKQPAYDWARLQSGVSAIMGREVSQARQAFQEIQTAGTNGFAPEDADLAKYFMNTARNLSSPDAIPADVTLDPTNYEALSLFAYGVKNIGLKDVTNAEALMQKFLAAKPAGKYAWISDYKVLAQKYLEDLKLYASWKKEGEEAKDPASIQRHLTNTREIVAKKKFQIFSELTKEVADSKDTLERQQNEQVKAENANRERQRQQEAADRAKVATEKVPQWLGQWKSTLINDLNTTHYNAVIATTTGVQYNGVTGATADGLRVKLPYGEAIVPWTQVPPQTLLAISTSFIKANTPDAPDRQWLSAVYALQIGQAAPAKQLAEAAANAKPEYKGYLAGLLQSKPGGH